MDNIIITYGNDDKIKDDFLYLPNYLYNKNECPQNYKLEKAILNGEHALSKDIQVIPFVAYEMIKGTKKPMARCLLTLYDKDNKAYVGFYESIAHHDLNKKLFNEIEKVALEKGRKSLVGPVDASFWIGYRFKIYGDKTFTCKPYNHEYYKLLWEYCGFEVTDTYISNMYRQVELEDKSEKCQKRLNDMKANGYSIRNISFWSFNKDIEHIYNLINETYSNFPLYKRITLNQFKSLFGYLRYILNYSMVKLAFKDNEAVGFVVCIPNYGENSMGKLTIKKLINILRIRNNPKEYVIAYMGVKQGHLGLGSALAEVVKTELYNNKCTSVGALIHENKVSGSYYNKLIIDRNRYVIMKKDIQ